MITYEVMNSKLSDVKLLDEDQVVQEIEALIEQFGLRITQKTTLSTMKGSLHYHLKQGNEAGILELTYWPQNKRLWVEIHDNRQAKWNLAMIQPFSEALAKSLSGSLQQHNTT